MGLLNEEIKIMDLTFPEAIVTKRVQEIIIKKKHASLNCHLNCSFQLFLKLEKQSLPGGREGVVSEAKGAKEFFPCTIICTDFVLFVSWNSLHADDSQIHICAQGFAPKKQIYKIISKLNKLHTDVLQESQTQHTVCSMTTGIIL